MPKKAAAKKAPAKKLLPTIPFKPGKEPSKSTAKRAATDYVAPKSPSRMATRTAAALPNKSEYADKPGAVQRAINRRERREERRYERNNPGQQYQQLAAGMAKKAATTKKAGPSRRTGFTTPATTRARKKAGRGRTI